MKYLVNVEVEIPLDQRSLHYHEHFITEDLSYKYVSLDEGVNIVSVDTKEISKIDAETLLLLKVVWSAYPGMGGYVDINGEEINEEEFEILEARK